MNIAKLPGKRVLIPTIAAVAVLGIGGTVWTATAGDESVQGGERDRVAAAAVEAVGGGEAVEVETSDDAGEAYEVEVRGEDGTETDVALDKDLEVVGQDVDDRDDDSDGSDDGDDGRADTRDADDRVLSDAERTSAEKAALEAVGGGTIVDVEASDDGTQAYEVEVRDGDDVEWDVDLDADFSVLDKSRDS
ncbi:PepSY domain-containing protein [Nocardioides pacificus]